MSTPSTPRRVSRRLTPRIGSAATRRGRSGFLIAGILVGTFIGVRMMRGYNQQRQPPRTYIAIDLSSQPPDTAQPSLFNPYPAVSHYDMIRVLHHAARDPSIKGVVCNLTPRGPWTLAAAQEIREAIQTLKEHRKVTVAYSDSFGDGGDGNTSYFIASACERVMLAPSGDVNLLGLFLQQPFIKNVLDRFNIKPQFIKRKEYKNAPNIFTESAFTPAHKEQLTSIGTSMYNQICAGIADGRNMSIDKVKEILANGPYTADEAKALGLIDEFIYEADIIDRFKWDKLKLTDGTDNTTDTTATTTTTTTAESNTSTTESSTDNDHRRGVDIRLTELPIRNKLVRFPFYANKVLAVMKAQNWFAVASPKIALIYGIGQVTTTPPSPFASGPNFHSATLAKLIQNATNDPLIKAIVFRIDSPGGSYIAADTVHAALIEAKARGKKVVVSMGSVAASGGYFAAAPADYIYADAGTITGSIGVFGGKFALRKFLEDKIGVTFDEIRWGGETAGMYRDIGEWNGAQLKKLDTAMDRVYADFVSKVSVGRGLSLEQTESVARGRVWTGEEAIHNGLVDGIGGLHDAIEKARELIPDKHRNALVTVLPRKKGIQRIISQAMGPGGDPEYDEEPLFQQSEMSSTMTAIQDGLNFIYDLTGVRDWSIAQSLWRSVTRNTTQTNLSIEDTFPQLINQNSGKGQF